MKDALHNIMTTVGIVSALVASLILGGLDNPPICPADANYDCTINQYVASLETAF